MRLLAFTFAVLACPNIYGATATACAPVNGIRYIAIPQGMSRADILRGGQEIATRLHELTRRKLADCPVDAIQAGVPNKPIDLIVIFVDGEGRPILPELESLVSQRERATETASLPSGALSFTFNSPSYPWSSEEQATLASQLGDFYPEARIVYGDPAFDIVVNVRKDPTITFAGLYYPSFNEMVLRGSTSPDVLCHEMIHAFRDDLVLGLNSYEEGMTRAAEVEVFDRLSAYVHPFDENHGYFFDVWYEGQDRSSIGSRGGSFIYGVLPLLRYQLSGYAWGKAYIENENFFINFNLALKLRAADDSTVLYSESQLVRIAEDAQPSVEGIAFSTWYANQFVLNTRPPVGAFVYQRLEQIAVDFFARDASGFETMQGNADLGWSVYDYQGNLFGGGTVTTSSSGSAYLPLAIPEGYIGRLRVTVTGNSAGATVEDTALRPSLWIAPHGIFGIVTAFDTGTITITPLSGPAPPTTVNVTNGAFSAPSLTEARGRFLAVFDGAAGQTLSRQFTKDASSYYLLMGENADPCVGPDLNVTRLSGQVTISWIPHGTSTYDVVRGSLLALRSSGGDFVQALGAISPSSQVCLANNASSLSINDTRALPPPNDGEFYLVRARKCGGRGTYDSSTYSQVSSRDDEIAAAVGACP